MTLEEVGRYFGITRERVRQIENRTLMRLKSFQTAGPPARRRTSTDGCGQPPRRRRYSVQLAIPR